MCGWVGHCCKTTLGDSISQWTRILHCVMSEYAFIQHDAITVLPFHHDIIIATSSTTAPPACTRLIVCSIKINQSDRTSWIENYVRETKINSLNRIHSTNLLQSMFTTKARVYAISQWNAIDLSLASAVMSSENTVSCASLANLTHPGVLFTISSTWKYGSQAKKAGLIHETLFPFEAWLWYRMRCLLQWSVVETASAPDWFLWSTASHFYLISPEMRRQNQSGIRYFQGLSWGE